MIPPKSIAAKRLILLARGLFGGSGHGVTIINT
jgi:hypothetical protein